MATFAHAYVVKERIAGTLLKHPKVFGVGVGYQDPKHPVRGAAVIVYANTLSAKTLGVTPMLKLPRKTGHVAVPIQVIRSGKIRSNADYTGRIRPVPAGYSVGTIAGSGTVGLIVASVLRANQLYIFSNNHVLTNPINSQLRAETLQPGGADNGRPVLDRVGYLSRLALLRRNSSNFIDAALSAPVRNSILSPRYATVGVIPGHVTSYRVGDRFQKVGRTTGLKCGTVTSVNTDILVDYGGTLGPLRFRNQTVIRSRNPISLPGDSGSVWLTQKDKFAAAVNYAGSDDGLTSVAFPVDWAFRKFRVRVPQAATTGRVCVVPVRNLSYARRLTANELASIRVVRIQGKGKRQRP